MASGTHASLLLPTSTSTNMTSGTFSSTLPPEIWIYIHRLATSDTSPLTLVARDADRFQYVPLADPFKEVQSFVQNACSFVLVCKLWNSLANELLYENIAVDDWYQSFRAMHAALERPGNSHLVRSIRLSTIRFDYNVQILALCPRVQLVVQPDVSNSDLVAGLAFRLASSTPPPFSAFHFLTHIYCTELLATSVLLRNLFEASPNLESLAVSRTVQDIDPVDSIQFSAVARLKTLNFVNVDFQTAFALVQTDLQGLTRLRCPAPSVSWEELSTLPSLHQLDIFGSRSTIPFPDIFSRCPRLRELSYDVWNDASPPQDEKSFLICIRLHSAVTVIRDWTPIERHFGLFLTSAFPGLQRLVLCGSWHRVVADAKFARFRDGLRERGCQLEFPEGHVLS